MSPTTTINQTLLDTVLGRLALLFLTGAAGDPTAAHQAAAQLLAAYNAGTEEELCLAAEIISFSFHALEALSQAADPNLSLNRTLRLRGSAVSLSRESHKSQRKLDQLQRARRTGAHPQPSETRPTQDRPGIDKALSLIESTREAPQTAIKTTGKLSWTQSFQQRQTAKRTAAHVKKIQQRQAAQAHLNATAATTEATLT
ncbi:MAG: hypothetical protein JWQ55_6267 [Rhodopila sp.]|nr:hypothetical protein [Rhodopila sp.]